MAATLPTYDPYGLFGSDPGGASVNNPMVGNPAGGSNANNPLVANPAGGTSDTGTPVNPGYNYNVSPGTQSGDGFFGGAPGQVQLPQPYQDLQSVVPGVGQANSEASSNLMAELSGGLSTGTLAALGQAQDAFGISGPINESPMSLGTTSSALQSQGLGGYSGLLPTIATTQETSPEVAAQIAEFNAQAASNPNNAAGTAQAAVSGAGALVGLLELLA